METKICNNCGESKSLACFHKRKKHSEGRRSNCKSCENIKSNKYRRTIPGLIRNIYNNQKQSSKRRGHPNPSYTKKELKTWLTNQPLFEELYIKWVDSGYERELVPSVDRLDDNLPYTIDNIRLTYWRINKLKYVDDVLRVNHPRRTPVNQYSLDGKFIASFTSISEAGRLTGIPIPSINSVCKNKKNRKTAGGFIFRYTSKVKGQEAIPAVKRYRGKAKSL